MSKEDKTEKSNIIKFELPKVIQVIEPVIVSKAEYNMMANYLDEEINMFSDSLPSEEQSPHTQIHTPACCPHHLRRQLLDTAKQKARIH